MEEVPHPQPTEESSLPDWQKNLPAFDGTCAVTDDADVVLVWDDGSKFHAHSVILRRASSVLKTALSLEHGGEINVRGASPITWRVLLGMVYSPAFIAYDIANVDRDIVEDVLREADKYQMDKVTAVCDEYLSNKCTEAGTSELLRLLVLGANKDLPKLLKTSASRFVGSAWSRVLSGSSEGEKLKLREEISNADPGNGLKALMFEMVDIMYATKGELEEVRRQMANKDWEARKLTRELGATKRSLDMTEARLERHQNAIEEAGMRISKGRLMKMKWGIATANR